MMKKQFELIKFSMVLGSLVVVSSLLSQSALALAVKGFSLTATPGHPFDAAVEGEKKTEAQEAVDYIHSLGGNRIQLTPEATMDKFDSNQVKPRTKFAERKKEAEGMIRLINYIHSKKMSVGFRPIVLVQDDSNGKWHGNIQPTDVRAWLQSFESFLKIYVDIAKKAKVEEFTVGAELYSMTVGIEDLWKEQPYGFPREWAFMIREIKKKLGPDTKIAYDINFTDKTVNSDGTGASGGEIERWRYRLVDLKPAEGDTSASAQAWHNLIELWKELDIVGIDVYRSLMSKNETIPTEDAPLQEALEARLEQYAQDLTGIFESMEEATGIPMKGKVVIKEIGFKSCLNGFIDPFVYDDKRLQVNLKHQSISYDAVLNVFKSKNLDWLSGITFWDIAVDPARAGVTDPGFTVRDKAETEKVIRNHWKRFKKKRAPKKSEAGENP